MKLTILFDHKFIRKPDGSYGSPTHYNYDLFKSRYLQVFDELEIICRTPEPVGTVVEMGPGVKLVSVGGWKGAFDFITKRPRIRRIVEAKVEQAESLLMIVPSFLSGIAWGGLRKRSRPYAVEVVGDPEGVFSPEACKHIFRDILRKQFTSRLKSLCANACCASYVTAEALQLKYPASKSAYQTNYSSIVLDSNSFASTPKIFSSTKKSWRIICVGAMDHPLKGQDLLVEALSVLRSNSVDATVVFVGDGALRNKLESQVASLSLNEYVHFTGKLQPGDQVRRELDNSDLYVLPSRSEGLPRVVIEAMARGLPCFGSDLPGVHELLPRECIFPVNDASKIAYLIADLVKDIESINKLSVRNLAASQKYSDEVLSQRRLDMYRELHRVCSNSIM